MPELTEEQKLELQIGIDNKREEMFEAKFQHCNAQNMNTQITIGKLEEHLTTYTDILNKIYNSDNYKQLQQNIQITYVLVCIVVMIILYITIIYVKQRWYTV